MILSFNLTSGGSIGLDRDSIWKVVGTSFGSTICIGNDKFNVTDTLQEVITMSDEALVEVVSDGKTIALNIGAIARVYEDADDNAVIILKNGDKHVVDLSLSDIVGLGNAGFTGGGAPDYNVYAAKLTQVGGDAITAGPLVVGRHYIIQNYVAGDDFSNVATVLDGTINANGCIFKATGTTPTDYSNGSALDVFQYLEAPVILGSNTIGSIVWEFDPVNNWYTGTLANAFTTDGKTVCLVFQQIPVPSNTLQGFDVIDSDTVILVYTGGDAGVLSIEIRVY